MQNHTDTNNHLSQLGFILQFTVDKIKSKNQKPCQYGVLIAKDESESKTHPMLFYMTADDLKYRKPHK